MNVLREETLPGEDILLLSHETGYAGVSGLDVFHVAYGEFVGDGYNVANTESFLSEGRAFACFEARLLAKDPSAPLETDRTVSLLLSQLECLVGIPRSISGKKNIDDWDNSFKHVADFTVGDMGQCVHGSCRTSRIELEGLVVAIHDPGRHVDKDITTKEVTITAAELYELVMTIAGFAWLLRQNNK